MIQNILWITLLVLALFTGVYYFVDFDIPGVGVDTECFIASAGMFTLCAIGMCIAVVLAVLIVKFVLTPTRLDQDHDCYYFGILALLLILAMIIVLLVHHFVTMFLIMGIVTFATLISLEVLRVDEQDREKE